tara:strand:- start:7164 stop:8789 length:1626 start_codon:yes stop_codon:yes gene_type:complete
MSFVDRLKIFFEDLNRASKLTKTNNKKIRILISAILSNFVVLFDLWIIIALTELVSGSLEEFNFFTKFVVDNLYLLPIVVLLRFLSIYLEKINMFSLQMKVEENLRINLLNDIYKSGNLSVSEAYYFIDTIAPQTGAFYGTLATFLGSSIQILAFSTYLLITDFQTISIFFIGVIVLFFPTLFLTKLGRKLAHKTYLFGNLISGEIQKVIDNLFLIKILKMINSQIDDFSLNLKKYYDSRLKDLKVGTINTIIPNFLTLFVISVLLVFFNFVERITIDLIGILLRLFQSLSVFNRNLHVLAAFHVYLEKLYEFDNNKNQVNENNFKTDVTMDSDYALIVDNVDFKYFGDESNTFTNLNLKFFKNKHTIITGTNGTGKSTLLGLLSGVLYPTSGKIISHSYNFGYVSASPMIINASLRDNLMYGNSDKINDSEMIEMINDFNLFNEQDVNILERNINNKNLSMGQMQKISFIRALLSNIDILILDESTSNLDQATKETIYKILNKANLTIINATHNPEDLINYDYHLNIFYKEDKKILDFVV